MQNPDPDPELRRRAEDEVREKGRAAHLPDPDVRRLCHELEVHQVELELQNEALQELQQNLRISEEKYRDLYDFAPIGYVTLDADGRIREANLAAASLLGEVRASLTNQKLPFFLERESVRDFTAFCGRVLAEGGKETVEVRLRATRDREPVWVLAEGRAGEGQTLRAALIDITRRKRAEEANKSRAALLNLTHDSIMVLDTAYRITVWNRGAEEQYGWPEPEAVGKEASKLLKTTFPKPPDAIRSELNRSGRWEGELVQTTRDGRRIVVASRWALQRNEKGDPVAILEINNDITERKRSEAALRESKEKLQTLFQFLPVGISILNEHRRVLAVNPALEDILDLPRDALLQGAYGNRRYIRPDGTEMPAAEFPSSRAIAEQIAIRNVEIGIEKENGGIIWTSVSAVPLPFSDWRMLLTTSGITERKRVEEALQRRTDDLIRQSREVEAARDAANLYVDIMTHDVRNANNVSSMYADLLVDVLAGDPWLYARRLRDSIERSSEILRNVATIRRAQQEPGRLVPVNLDAVIREEIGNFPGASIRYDGPHVGVMADNLLPVIFTNLIGNGVKFGGEGVEIAIRVEEQDGEVLVSVEDTGPGVPDEVKGMLFTRFERGIARGRGEGLGLFLVRMLVERYGGKAWIDDRIPGSPDEGAAFRFTLRKGDHA